MKNYKSKSKTRHMISLLIVLSPVLSIYKIENPSMGFGDISILIAIIVSMIFFGRSIVSNLPRKFGFISMFLFFFIISLFDILIFDTNINFSDFINKWCRLTVYAFMIDIVVKRYIDKDFAELLCIILSLIFSIFLLIQYSLKNFGICILPYLRKVLINYSVSNADYNAIQLKRFDWGIWRPSSIFLEPAHFVQFTIIAIVLLLFKTNKLEMKKKYLYASIITIAIILSGSANGYFIVLFIWFFWLFKSFNGKVSFRRIVFLIVSILLASFFIIKSNVFSKAMYRLKTVNEFSEGSTGGTRLLQGIYVYIQLNPIEKLLGVGFGNVSNYLITHSITTPFLSDIGNEYMNAFSTVLVSGGLVCFAIYMYFWIKNIILCKNVCSKMVLLVLSFLCLTSSMFYSSTLLYYFAFTTFDEISDIKKKHDRSENK